MSTTQTKSDEQIAEETQREAAKVAKAKAAQEKKDAAAKAKEERAAAKAAADQKKAEEKAKLDAEKAEAKAAKDAEKQAEKEHKAEALAKAKAEREEAKAKIKAERDAVRAEKQALKAAEQAKRQAERDAKAAERAWRPGKDSIEDLAVKDDKCVVRHASPEGSGLCQCGCGEKTKRDTAKFIAGHDARLKGILQRAHLNGAKIRTWDGSSATLGSPVTAMAVAKTLGWELQLQQAEERAKAADAA